MNFSFSHKLDQDDLNLKYEDILETIKQNTSDIIIFAENNFPYLVIDNHEFLALQNDIQFTNHVVLGLIRKEDEKI